MKLIASPLALDLLLALTQRREGARLADLATAVGAPLTSAQRAIRVVLADRVVERHGRTRPFYRLRAEHPGLSVLIDLAYVASAAKRALRIILRASRAVEFAARDEMGYVIVRSAFADPTDVVELERGLARIRSRREEQLPVVSYEHDDLRELLREDPSPRERALRAEVVRGSVRRSFPERRHGPRVGRPLGRAHRSVPHVSRRALRALAREHGLHRVALFGSAVRSDFRPDSDIDVLIEPRPEARLTLLDLAAIRERLERLFDRDVDLLTPGGLRPEMRERIEREAVALDG